MLEFFNGIRIKGRCFENETSLIFFPKDDGNEKKGHKDARVSLVYGRNGSGKSTVARAFTTFKNNTPVQGVESVAIEGELVEAELSQLMYVFNEDYVQEKIVLKSGKRGLGTIALFGEQVEIENEIKACRERIKQIKEMEKDYSTRLISFFYSLEPVADNFTFDNLHIPSEEIFERFVSLTEWANRNEEVFGQNSEVDDYDKQLGEMLTNRNSIKVTQAKAEYKRKLQRLRINETKPDSVMRKRVLDQLKGELATLNFVLSGAELREVFGKETEEIKKYYKEYNSIKAVVKEKASLTNKIRVLKKSSKTTKIAADQINASLAYIFMSDKRLRLYQEDNVYKVESNGHPVEPRDISIGERNALAISYFFLDMMSGTDAKSAHEQERLIVLDDPVSSFDHENKMGVLSYILFEMERLRKSKFVCLMHDLHPYVALSSSIEAYDKTHCKNVIGQSTVELDSKHDALDPLVIKDLNEYRVNFEEVYDYACLGRDELTENCHIGNQMRRILEAFSTFVYRSGIQHIFYGELIKGENADFYNTFFRSRFARFVVNDESHTEKRILSLADYNSLFPFITLEERQKAIRESICLLYLLHSEHVMAMLDKHTSRESVEENINSWLATIRKSTPSLELVL